MAKFAKKAKGRKFKPRFKRSAKRSSWKKKSYGKKSGGALSAKVKRIVRSMEQTNRTMLNPTTTTAGVQFNAFAIWSVLGQGPPGPILAIAGSTTTTTSWGALLPPFNMTAPTVGQPGFVGYRCEPKSLRVKLALDLNNVLAAKGQVVDITVDIYILTSKQIRAVELMENIEPDALLAPTSSDTAPYDGTIQNSQYPINTRDFTVLKHQRIRMVKNYGDNPVTYPQTVIAVPAAPYPAVQDHSAFRNVAFNIKCPAKLLFDRYVDTTVQSNMYPSNWNPMIAIGWFYNSSQAPLAVSPLTITGTSYLSYKNLI